MNEKQAFLSYCPKCGNQGIYENGKAKCPFCGTKELPTKYDWDEWLWGNSYPSNLEEIIYNEYVKPNPLFDEELFAQRVGKEKLLQQATLDKQNAERLNTLKCPKCGSTAVAIGQKGFSLLTGFIGSSQTMNRCGKCGYKWKPRR